MSPITSSRPAKVNNDRDGRRLVELSSKLAPVIEDEFLALIPPLSFDELAELEASLVEYGGARDPLIAWDRGPKLPPVLVDGHTRLRICERLKLPYHVKGLRFRDKDDALNWMRRNQIGRRNLSRKAFMLLLGEIYNRTKLPDGGRAGRKSHPYAGREVRRTADVLAEEYGVDEKTVRRAAAFQNAAEKLGIADEIAAGRIKADAAAVIKLAASLPENPTKDQIAEALKAGLTRARAQCKKDSLSRASQGWLIPAEPSDCLKAIYFYAKSFLCRRPDGVEALNALLLKLIEENELQVINQRHERGR